jgi:hypothetical protein
VSDLFDPEPETWGLRGDPHLWRALRAHLAGQDVPVSADELASLLHAAFRELTGTDLTSDPASPVYRERYAHGGMSSGMISLGTWRQRLMPMLFERAGARLPGRPRRQTMATRPLIPRQILSATLPRTSMRRNRRYARLVARSGALVEARRSR